MNEQRPCAHLECATRWAKSGKVPSEFKCMYHELEHYTVTITLNVKAESPDDAVKIASNRLTPALQVWLGSDSQPAPFPRGSLLFWNITPRRSSDLTGSDL